MPKKSPAVPPAHQPLTPARIKVFLDHLREHGVVTWAARAASPNAYDRKGASSSFYTLRARDPGFAEEWDAAIEEANDRLIIEARRRAIEGVPRLRTFKDQLIKITDPDTGEERPLTDHEYSDRLLEILLKGGFPDRYVERRITKHINRPTPSGWTITREDMIVLSDQEQDQLLQIVSKVRRARRESSNMIKHHPAEVIEIEAEPVAEEVEV